MIKSGGNHLLIFFFDIEKLSIMKCYDKNLQMNYRLVVENINEINSKKIIVDVANKLSFAYNHGEFLRCFNAYTDIFPWDQYLSGRY